MLRIIDQIQQFDFFKGQKKVGKASTKTIIDDPKFIDDTFPFRQIIGFENKFNSYVKMDLLGQLEDTTVKPIYWNYFDDATLINLSKKLDFKLRSATHKKRGDKLLGFAENTGNYLDLQIGLRQYKALIYYVVLFHLNLPDLYRGAGRFEGKLYVHGIWKAEIDGQLAKK
ncbi:MAG: hypothetical protein AAF620_18650 [Bacteroidota bacterium]